MEEYSTPEQQGYKFSIEKFNNGKLYYKLMSENIKWDSTSGHWIIVNYFIRTINGTNETFKKGERIDTSFAFTPADFGRKDNTIETKDYKELNEYIESEKLR
jgi:lipopolysaccharide export system permease protein